jgi:hypothetical protein
MTTSSAREMASPSLSSRATPGGIATSGLASYPPTTSKRAGSDANTRACLLPIAPRPTRDTL